MSTNRIKVLLISMLAVFAISAVASGSASATCYKVAVKETGNYKTKSATGVCEEKGEKREYIKATVVGPVAGEPGVWCAKVEEAKTGTFKNTACTEAEAKGEFIKVMGPRFVHCVKQATKTFEYTEKECKTKSTNKTGEFEKESVKAGVGKLGFTDEEGLTVLKAKGPITITCKKAKSKGKITGPNTVAEVEVTFEECEAENKEKVKCPVNGGTIKTVTLSGELGPVAAAEAVSEVGEDLKPTSGKIFVKLEGTCIPTTSVEGSVIGEVKPINTITTKGELIYKCFPPEATSTIQEIEKFVGVPKDTLTAFGAEACFQSNPDTVTFEEPIEVAYP